MKTLSIIGKVLRILLYILAGVVAVFVTLVLIFGWKLYCIQTGSMEPSYPVGMMIIVEPVSFGQLEEGNVITFVNNDNITITHRAVEIDEQNQMITTKGDNNNVADSSPVSFKNVIGRVKFGIPLIGYFILILNTTFGKWMIAIAAVALVGIAIIRRMYYSGEDDPEEENEDCLDDEQGKELKE